MASSEQPAAPSPVPAGAPTSLSSPPPPPPASGPSPPDLPASPARRRLGRRLLGGWKGQIPRLVLFLLLLAGFVLSAVSLGTAWWVYQSSGGNSSATVLFNPGSTYSVSCTGSGCGGFAQGSFSYNSFGSAIGSLYGSLDGALIFVVVLAAIATAIGILAIAGRIGRGLTIVGSLLGIAAGGALIGLSLWVESSQPGSFAASVTFQGAGGQGPNPTTSFWGTADAGGSSAVWGAGAGWYGALIGGTLLVAIAIVLVLATRSATPRRVPAPAPRASPPVPRYESPTRPVYAPIVHTSSPVAYSPPPMNAPVQASAKTPVPVLVKKSAPTPEPMVDCPSCGYQNPSAARKCGYCQRPMAPA